jgi:translation initiation factor 6
MAVIKDIIYGGPNMGVYLALSNKVFLYPPKVNPKMIKFVQGLSPNIIPIETFINGASVIGVYVAMNSNGMIVPSLIHDSEMIHLRDSLPKDFTITEIDSDDNTFGNLILCNDKGAIISPLLTDALEAIEKTLKVPVKIFNFAKSKLPGSCGLVNSRGVVVHPVTTDKEAETISQILKVNIDVSTINCGNPFLRGGAVVNDFGGIFGRSTTGPEISRCTEILELN